MGEVLTPETLDNLAGDRVYLGVVGDPIDHSLSPVFQNAALQKMAQSDERYRNWTYVKIHCPVERLGELLEKARGVGFVGLNLTLPHKIAALDLVDQLCPDAEKIGAVNTVHFRESETIGYNTDGAGFSKGVRRDLEVALGDRDVVVIGAGGAARAVAFQALDEGCKTLTILNRTQSRLQSLVGNLKKAYPGADIVSAGVDADSLIERDPEALYVQTTSLGLKSDDPLPINDAFWEEAKLVYDVVYSKDSTRLVTEITKRGGKAADGRGMLVLQGAESLKIWTDEKDLPIDVMMHSLEEWR